MKINYFAVFCGYIINNISRINKYFLSNYKTYCVRKNNPNVKKIGSDTIIKGNIKIGENTYINGGVFQALNDSYIKIGKNCLISYDVKMRTDTHIHKALDIPISEQGHEFSNIVIGNNVWIGEGAYIMPGVEIGDGAIIGAHAVVTKNVEQNTIVAGVPAKVIRTRLKRGKNN